MVFFFSFKFFFLKFVICCFVICDFLTARIKRLGKAALIESDKIFLYLEKHTFLASRLQAITAAAAIA